MLIKTPGKLILAGEWNVLEPGNSCIVAAIDRYVKTCIKKSDKIIVIAPQIGVKQTEVTFDACEKKIITHLDAGQEKKFAFAKNALEVVCTYLYERDETIDPFEVTLDSEDVYVSLDDGKRVKIGFGSSAAITVSIIKAVLAFHDYDVFSDTAKDIVFKLACIAHTKAQDYKGSCFDVAASVYETTLHYKRFCPKWFARKIKKNGSIVSLVQENWPMLEITPLILPEKFRLCVGFVGYSATTKQVIKHMQKFKKKYTVRYKYFCARINKIVLALVDAVQEKDRENILELIKQNRKLLQQLSYESGDFLETVDLTKLINRAEKCGAASKLSGAGGGDCGIAVCFDKMRAERINRWWRKDHYYPVEAHIL